MRNQGPSVLWTQKTNPSRLSETREKIFAFPSDQIQKFPGSNLFLFLFLEAYRFSAVSFNQLFCLHIVNVVVSFLFLFKLYLFIISGFGLVKTYNPASM